MEVERTKCGQFSQLSLEQLLLLPQFIGKIILRLNQNYAKSPKGKLGRNFVEQLYYDFVPTQSQPMLIKHLAYLASKATRKEQISFLNLCGGWGDRLVGALAAPEINRIIETDPNTALIPLKQDMINLFGTGGKEIHLHGSPAEDLTEGQLKPASRENDLVVMCPPYYTTERYAGDVGQQSHSRYVDIIKWLNEFLFELVKISFCSLSECGLLAVHIGETETISDGNKGIQKIYGEHAIKDRKYNLPFILDHYMAQFKEMFSPLNPIVYGHKTGRSDGSYVRIYQKLNFPRLEYPLSTPGIETDRMCTNQAIVIANMDDSVSKYLSSLSMYAHLAKLKTSTVALSECFENILADELTTQGNSVHLSGKKRANADLDENPDNMSYKKQNF